MDREDLEYIKLGFLAIDNNELLPENESLEEAIEKQPTVNYKGFTVEHFPISWTFKGETIDKDGWIIQAPGYFVGGDKRFPLPLRCHNSVSGPELDFTTLEEAKEWIDKFGSNYRRTIEFGDEIHAWPGSDDETLTESAKTDFIDKFGQDTFNNFEKAKQRLVNKGMSVDYGQYLKKDKKEIDDLILSLYDDKKDAQRKRIIQGKDKEIRGKYRDLGIRQGYHVFEPLTPQASMDLGVNTGWCTTGRYGHYGHPEFTPSIDDARKHWNSYTRQGVRFFYLLNPDTMYGEYAIALYPKVFEREIEVFTFKLKKSNVEIYNAKDDLDYSIIDKLDLDSMIGEEVICDYEELEEVEIKDNKLIRYRGQDKHFVIPNSVTSIRNCAFTNCNSLTSITIPNSVTLIGDYAFGYCKFLKSINIPNSVTSIGSEAFFSCSSLTSIAIPNSVTSIGNYAFVGCHSLTAITIPDSITSIGTSVFAGCSSLTSITIPNSVKLIDEGAFAGCTYLSSVIIPDSVSKIGDVAFDSCRALTSITIPDSVTSIGKDVFRACFWLTVKTNNEYVINYCKSNHIKYTNNLKETLQGKTIEKTHSFFESSIEEEIEVHDHLNPKLWDENNELLPEVRSKILEIVDKFKEQLAEDNVKLEVADIYLLGSNANYNYNSDSDLDLHVIADETFDCSEEHLKIIYNAYKSLFNNKYDIKVHGIETEIYVENKDQLTNVSSGVYSLNNGWIKKPTRSQIPEIDQVAVDLGVKRWEDKYFKLTLAPTVEKIDKYIDDIYDMRTASIAKDGEFGEGNLIFKEIRRIGYLEDLKELKTELISRELSLE